MHLTTGPSAIRNRSWRSTPEQWHLTAEYAPTDTVRRLITVIVVSRSDRKMIAPEIQRLEGRDMLGARIGDATVQFRLNMPAVAVTCRGIKEDGTLKWLEYSGAAEP